MELNKQIGESVVFIYLPNEIVSPKVIKERMTVITVAMGLNIETRTGPLFFIAHPLKLKHVPLTAPPCASELE